MCYTQVNSQIKLILQWKSRDSIMTQRLKALAALEEDLSLVSSTHLEAHNHC